MTRDAAIAEAEGYFDSGRFVADLARRVAIPTESQNPARSAELCRYLDTEIGPAFAALGFACRVVDNPRAGGPFLIAIYRENDGLPTVFTYGHGDVIHGQDKSWRTGLSPWTLVQEGDRLYGRGTADNKGQHSINLGALAAVRKTRGGRLGFNVAAVIEMGEEVSSPGLKEVIAAHREALRSDLLIASDGPRVAPERPTLFMGARGCFNFELVAELRKGAHHSGNWGGLIANAGTMLAQAIATLVGPRGQILVPELKPARISNSVRDALADIAVDGGAGAPLIDTWWGEPGLTPAEKVYGWNAVEVLAFTTGDPEKPVNAIPGRAVAHCQIRFTVDTDPAAFLPAIEKRLKAAGLGQVKARPGGVFFPATRLDPDHPVASWAAASLARTTGKKPGILPNLGGSLPNDLFVDLLGLPTVWVPHSYTACSQHAPDEHLLASVAREGLGLMAGLFWDLGEGTLPRARGL